MLTMFSSSGVALLFLATAATAQQTVLNDVLTGSGSQILDYGRVYQAYPEYSLDLDARRLVQLDNSARPLALTEMEKV